ncbi:MAG TPA: hypothetical protein PKD18_12845 [Saprospiraceae bacterium]|nr:hypothetical protein [Saprospiraceae bacterium]
MFSFFKKKTDDTPIPEWASFFDSKEYTLFIKEIENYLKSLNIQFTVGDGQVDVNENEFGFNNLGLVNVAQVCKQEDKKHYKEIITEHFNSMIKANKFDKEFQKIADNFEEVKKYIGVRLYHNEYVAYVGKENTIGKAFAGDIYSMIVYDFPDSVLSIKPEQIIPWNKTVDELFEIGIANIKAKYPVSITNETFGEFSIWFIQGEHFFTPNIVFDIENRQELIGSKGSLIGLPHRYSAIIYPIENLEVVKAINGIIPTIYGMNQEGPGSLSNNLFWYKDKTFTQLPYKIEEGKLQFFPPETFIKLLNELK